jgi:hypothetical protein
VRLATFRQFGRYFGRVRELDDGGRETLQWLAGQPQLAAKLLMLTSAADPPDRVLEVLRALRADHRTDLEEFADLAAAMCVVWDAPEHFAGQQQAGAAEDPKIDPATVVAVFEHFQKNAPRLRFDPRKTPADLLVYVVDLTLTPDELKWAGQRYSGGGRADVPGLFAAVPYDESAPYDRQAKPAGGDPAAAAGQGAKPPPDEQLYLLPNLLRRGGSTGDQAYFACQVARATGVPAVVCRGAGESDGRVAWVGFWSNGGGRAGWNFSAAKYREYVGWAGEAIDPQTGSAVEEGEVALTARLLATPPRDRLAARAMIKSADLVTGAADRLALLRRAVELSPGDRWGWFALADLVAERKLDDGGMKPVEALLRKALARDAGFATYLRLRMLDGRGSLEWERGAERAADAVRDRPELAAGVLVALADRQSQEKRWKAAATTLYDALRRFGGASPAVAWSIVRRLDVALHHLEEPRRLAEIYRELFNAMPRPNPVRHGRTTPYYRIGAQYAAVLEELAEAQKAGVVRARIEGVVR